MRKFTASIFAFLLIGTLSFAQSSKIGFVNVELILSQHPDVKGINVELDKKRKDYSTKVQNLQNQYMQKMQEYETMRNNPMTNPVLLKDLETEIIQLEQRIQSLSASAEQELMMKQSQLLEPVLNQVKNAIDDVAKAKNFEYVINQNTADGTSIVIYAKNEKENNLTIPVMEKLGITVPAELLKELNGTK